MTTKTPPTTEAVPETKPAEPQTQTQSAVLADELNRLETTERAERDRRKQEELARLRELARFD